MDILRAREVFVNHLKDHLIRQISGENVDRISSGQSPENLYFVGRLGAIKGESSGKFSFFEPNQIGMEFLLKKSHLKDETLEVTISADLFVRMNPDLKEQQDYWLREFNRSNPDNQIDSFIDLVQANEAQIFMTNVVPVYQKIRIDNFIFKINCSSIVKSGYYFGRTYLEKENEKILNLLYSTVEDLEGLFTSINDQVCYKDLMDNKSWENFLKLNGKSKKEQTWDSGILCEIRENGPEHVRVLISFQNRTQDEKNKKDRINTFFNCSMKVKTTSEIVPMELSYLNNDYKYDRYQIAIGKNCSVEKVNKRSVKTISTPTYRQKRLVTRDNLIKVRFRDLVEDPTPLLKKIVNLMEKEIFIWEQDLQNRKDKLPNEAIIQFDKEIKGFIFEKNRFAFGIKVLEKYPLILKAFQFMNEAFLNASKGKYESWRLFQIVFIVSVLSDIASREYSELEKEEYTLNEEVDLIYFPTGGGKTESYLGAVVFNMFFDRLRQKNSGTTAIMKFPLRLLSLQQLQRATNITAQAELIRRREGTLNKSEPFSVGYFVGANNTPNSLIEKNDNYEKDLVQEINDMTQQEKNDKYLITSQCPFCSEESVIIDVLEKERRLIHRCGNKNCSEDILPIYIVDREVYRYLPTFIVSTLDKSALIGLQRNFRNILGNVSGRCPIHGYTSKKKCTEEEVCKVPYEDFENVNLYDPAPSLIIQDELHLVRESLGAFNAHYETFINYFLRQLSPGKKPIKVIAATATISEYEQQVYHLYKKQAHRFPASSPYLDKNFYSYVDDKELNRIIVGIAPYGKTPIYSILDILQYYREEVYKFWKEPNLLNSIEGISGLSIEECKKVIKEYWVMLEYNQIKNEGMQVVQSVKTMTNDRLKESHVPALNVKTMTGDDTFKDIRTILNEIERPKGEIPNIDLIAATSMISHGVDADSFNFMLFYGVPKNTAEYIQAYSRAGRKYPALIMMVFNSNREKDTSYNQHFVKFNEYKDILVEPVPINRWANKAVEKTLPGLFSALLLNHYEYNVENNDNKLYMLSGFQEAYKNGVIPNADGFAKELTKAYGATDDSLGNFYKEEICRLTNQIIDRLMSMDVSVRNDYYITQALSKIGFPVMRSLRDTDIQIPVIMEGYDASLVMRTFKES